MGFDQALAISLPLVAFAGAGFVLWKIEREWPSLMFLGIAASFATYSVATWEGDRPLVVGLLAVGGLTLFAVQLVLIGLVAGWTRRRMGWD